MKCDKCGYEVHGYEGQACPGCEEGRLQAEGKRWYKPSSILDWLSKKSSDGESFLGRIKVTLEPKEGDKRD